MKKKFSPLKNEKGFGSIIIVLAVTSVASLMIMQLSVAFHANRMLHKKTALRSRTARHMQGLAQKVKRGFDMAEIDSSCASLGSGFIARELPGHTTANPRLVCINPVQGLCITDESMFGDTTPVCVNTSTNSFDWSYIGGGGTPPPVTFGALTTTTPPTTDTFGATSRSNTIRVPPRTDPLWKSCAPPANNCIRLEMCPPGELSCTADGEKITQVIRIGL